MGDLEAKLQQASGARVKLIATDGMRHMHQRAEKDLSVVDDPCMWCCRVL
jgi:hypothetical protein